MKYRKKQAQVDAVQLTWETWSKVCDLARTSVGGGLLRGLTPGEVSIRFPLAGIDEAAIYAIVPTSGNCLASQTDWIIRDENGFLSICTNLNFILQYEAIE